MEPVEKRDLAINGAIAAVGIAWAVLSEYSKFNPAVISAVAFVIRLNAKLSALNPSSADKDKAKVQDGKRLLRAVGLTLGALSLGIVLTVTVPTALSQTFRFALPFAYFAKQVALLNVAAVILMFGTASYFR